MCAVARMEEVKQMTSVRCFCYFRKEFCVRGNVAFEKMQELMM